MKLKEYHPIEEMERFPVEKLPDKIDELFDRVDQENIGFVLTKDGQDAMVLCPYRWFEPEYETVEIEVDSVDFARRRTRFRLLGKRQKENAGEKEKS